MHDFKCVDFIKVGLHVRFFVTIYHAILSRESVAGRVDYIQPGRCRKIVAKNRDNLSSRIGLNRFETTSCRDFS